MQWHFKNRKTDLSWNIIISLERGKIRYICELLPSMTLDFQGAESALWYVVWLIKEQFQVLTVGQWWQQDQQDHDSAAPRLSCFGVIPTQRSDQLVAEVKF